ncbi:MAG: dTDP-4-dehydrorhamnose reductase [Eubacteriales bacterium]
MKNIIVTGCNGQLGRAINAYYANHTDLHFVNTDIDELDISNIDQVMTLAKEVNPYAIINCSAFTAVDLCETNQEAAFRANAIGPRNLSIAATETGSKLVHISTDYVFDGNKETPYLESDPVGPETYYGYTKELGEQFVKEFSYKHFILRTAWLYGDGNNFAKTMLRLSETNDKVRVVSDQFGTPTSTIELVKGIDSLLFTDNYGLFHGTCEGSCCWADFAKEIFRLAGKDTVVEYITSDEYKTPAKRPANSVLENQMFALTNGYKFGNWQDAITLYMKTL